MIIKSAEFICSSPAIVNCPTTGLPEFAVIGRSNVGKSSLINALTNNKNLCKTSGKPGKTRLINHFLINKEWYLVDLPGYGFAKIPMNERKRLDQLISSYIINRKELKKLFILVDSRHEPMKIDMIFIENFIDLKISFAIVMTKCDKISTSVIKSNQKVLLDKISGIYYKDLEIIPTSSEKKSGMDILLNSIETSLKIKH